MPGEHLVVAIAENELSMLSRTGVLALFPTRAGRELRARAERVRPLEGERYELVVGVLRAMTVVSGVLLIAAIAVAELAPHHPLIWRPVFAAILASVAFHSFLLSSIAIRIGLRQNPVWPSGRWLVAQAGALALVVGLGVVFG